jgi:Flp pilus assembly protein protease CpaA
MVCFGAWLTACAVWDVRTRAVPAWLTIPALVGAAAYRWLEGGWGAVVLVATLPLVSVLPRPVRLLVAACLVGFLLWTAESREAGLVLALSIVWLAWELSLVGGADAKIMVAVVLVTGSGWVLVPVAVAGGILAVGAAFRNKLTIPCVVAIAVGTACFEFLVWFGEEDAMMKRFLNDNAALESTEVALLIAAVVLVAYAAYRILGQRIAEVVMDIAGRF